MAALARFVVFSTHLRDVGAHGPDGCVDLDEIFLLRPTEAASANLAGSLPLRE